MRSLFQHPRGVHRETGDSHTREKARLPQHQAPATYPSRWQAPRSSDSASSAFAKKTAASSPSNTCRASPTFRPAGGIFSAAQKIEHLIGLDRCYEILSWPWAGLDPLRRSMQIQVIRVLLPIGIKALLDGSLGRDAAYENNRAAVLQELARDLGVRVLIV